VDVKKNNLFFQKVYAIVSRIPSGKVVSYGQIAAFLGNPRSSRMVGLAMHGAHQSIPWHRVVMKSGKLPFDGVSFDSTSQKELLAHEGITFFEDGTVDMKKHIWQIELPL
jgi:methylated-DNA-protein-cysteine methyltransferase related protein